MSAVFIGSSVLIKFIVPSIPILNAEISVCIARLLIYFYLSLPAAINCFVNLPVLC